MESYPERCAELHNALLQKAIENDPSAVTETTLITRLLEAAPQLSGIPGLRDLPAYRFLSLLKTARSRPQQGPGLLTPQMYQPDPFLFWSGTFSVGVILNLRTCRAIWHWEPGPFPDDEQWVSLEIVLRNALAKWDSGKYYWDVTLGSICVRAWTQTDLSEALAARERLLCGIEARLPESVHKSQRLEPLEISQEMMSAFRVSRFVGEFLSRAPRPGFTFVAPGITTFSTEALQSTHASKDPASFRRSTLLGQEDPDDLEWASLLLPTNKSVDQDTSRHANSDIQSFDKPWGLGKFTVSRQAGLYVIPEVTESDTVQLITSSGLTTAGEFRGRCPWGKSRPPTLAEIFGHWASLVESGTWAVAADGVAEDHNWFDRHAMDAKLDWHDHLI
ncbi:hypothetical protein N8I77_011046 [Diaporthe amygdali]|uniref:Uncharacterized protein n=1 Tax=Phomopsis amygdali TaxID=1214568 RepID=A0AAD9S4K9_PHOAM|nr:hypothetical protein N8I77_011046 [Diaporthe amygdali]